MTARHRLLILPFMVIALLAGGAQARDTPAEALDAVVNAPLRSQDPAAPIQVIASNWWLVTDKASPEMIAAIDPKHQMRMGATVDVGTFTVDGSKGPVSLVVDYGALQGTVLNGATGGVNIGIECLDKPMACPIPINKTILLFHGDLMAQLPVSVKGQVYPLAVGRDAQTYHFPAGEPVRVKLELATPHKLSPVLVKAWLIYGKNAADVVPGQTSKANAIWMWVAGGALALGGLMWRLRRH